MKGLGILHQKGQVYTTMMEHYKSMLSHKFGPAEKQYTYQAIKTIEHVSSSTFVVAQV